jgi:hypothetical protein
VKVDRYTKVVLTVIAVAVLVTLAGAVGNRQPAVAAAQVREGRYQLVVPGEPLFGRDRAMVIDTRSGTLYNAKPVLDRSPDDHYHFWTLEPGVGYTLEVRQ